MLEEGAYKEILHDDYKRHRQQADKFRKKGQTEKAARHYRKASEILEKVAEIESGDKLAAECQELASNLREVAKTLKNVGYSQKPPESSEENTNITAVPDHRQTNTSTSDNDGLEVNSFLEPPPDLEFDDVGGMTDLKQTLIDKVVDPLERPELYEKYNLSVVNGILLYGPPGTGKTHITRALAGKLNYNFIEVTPSDITSSLVGEAAQNMATLFQVAQENQPCLVFIDEIDGIAGKRSGGAQKTQSERQMVNQLLTELSDIQGEDIVVVAATNLLEEVDDAIKRSGRFDERIEVPPPDGPARIAILRIHLRNRPVLPDEIDWRVIRRQTEGYSASDLELIANNAARKALQEAREQDGITHIQQSHLEAAIEETESSLIHWQS